MCAGPYIQGGQDTADTAKNTSPRAVLPKIDSAPVLDTDSVLPRIDLNKKVAK